REVLDRVERVLQEEGAGQVRVLIHSLAFGTLRPYISDKPEEAITKAQMDMTLDVMAHSLVYWGQDLVGRRLMGRGGRIYAMTSAGGTRIFPTYGAVSAAKAALESHIRQLAFELAPLGITVNAIRAGVTDTPSSRKIPGYEKMAELAAARNPMGRLTTPADVAAAIAVLCQEGTHWITGNVIGVDGGEDVVA
ncbi:MAG: SDR family oxidoreductase, partial [Nitrospinae bacterium]|nr:SDR family oxidoreductase [Nitrospinota bacterium]